MVPRRFVDAELPVRNVPDLDLIVLGTEIQVVVAG